MVQLLEFFLHIYLLLFPLQFHKGIFFGLNKTIETVPFLFLFEFIDQWKKPKILNLNESIKLTKPKKFSPFLYSKTFFRTFFFVFISGNKNWLYLHCLEFGQVSQILWLDHTNVVLCQISEKKSSKILIKLRVFMVEISPRCTMTTKNTDNYFSFVPVLWHIHSFICFWINFLDPIGNTRALVREETLPIIQVINGWWQ